MIIKFLLRYKMRVPRKKQKFLLDNSKKLTRKNKSTPLKIKKYFLEKLNSLN